MLGDSPNFKQTPGRIYNPCKNLTELFLFIYRNALLWASPRSSNLFMHLSLLMTNIGLVDDNSAFRNRIANILSTEPGLHVTMRASDGYELLNCLYTQKDTPEILLVDVNIPKMDGIALTDFITDNFPSIKVIGVSSYVENETIEDIFSCGAWGYVFKMHLETLVTAIRTVLKGEAYIDPRIGLTNEMRNVLIEKRNERKEMKKSLGITRREGTFLSLSATDMEYSEISNLMFVERKTLDRFFSNISKKIEVKNRHHLTLFALRHGLVKLARYTGKTC